MPAIGLREKALLEPKDLFIKLDLIFGITENVFIHNNANPELILLHMKSKDLIEFNFNYTIT
jgi:hypothetical protein